jgi:Ser/Thr protein kinase RdoA (MazF antagonist)
VLGQKDVARYLLDRGLLGPEAVLDGNLVISDASSRNWDFRVETEKGPCYLLKQGASPEGVATVAHEAGVYQQLARGPDGVAALLPRFYRYDTAEGVLVLELVRDAEDLRSLQLRTGRFPAGLAAVLGAALGTLHRGTWAAIAPSVPSEAPWVFRLHRPGAELFRDVSAAGLELIGVVQGAPGFAEALERARDQWSAECLIHGDVKWENCLVEFDGGGGEGLRLIDWESATQGDPCWDIGSALSPYLSCWLFSIPVTGRVPPERFPELAGYPLDAMKPALTACWTAYVEARELCAESAADLLLRTVEFAGLRLVQTAFEAAQMMHQLTSSLVLHLQLALNVLQRPEEAAAQLLGLPLARSRVR